MKFERGTLIGDPHLGRKFEVGVPVHRRGERERELLADFRRALLEPGDMTVMVGDLFDHPYVPHTVVKEAIDAVLDAAARRPFTEFVMMAGNHDMPRKITATGGFDVFARACRGRLDNLQVLTEPTISHGVAFFPWQWDVSALEQVRALTHGDKIDVEAAVGHWDLSSFGGEDLHLAPVAALRDAFGEVPLYSGHYHTPGDYEVAGSTVHGTGSLQPLTHAEDPTGRLYVTMSLEAVQEADPAALRDLCLRVDLLPGQELPDGLDARAVIGRRVAAQQEAGETVALDRFDWAGILRDKLAPLTPGVRGFIEERLPNAAAE